MHYFCKRILLTLSVAFLTICSGYAQKLFTLEQLTPGSQAFYRDFYPSSISLLQWSADRLLWVEGDKLMQQTTEGNASTLMTAAQLMQLLPSEKSAAQSSSRFPYFSSVAHSHKLILQKSDALYLLDPDQQKIIATLSLSNDATPLAIDPQGRAIVLKDKAGALTVQPLKALKQPGHGTIFAQDEADSIVYGEAVHQREFGIETGIFFSPDAQKIAFYRMDQSMVAGYPIIDYAPKKAEVHPLRYPMAGDSSHHVTIGIYDVMTQKTIYLKTGGDPEHYLTNISFTPDGKGLLVAEINRAQNHLQMNLYNTFTGEKQATLFEESEAKYLDPSIAPHFLPHNPKQFVWCSRRDGYNHIYLYDLQGKMLRQITKGSWEVLEIKGFSPSGDILYEATKASPLERRLYKSRLSQYKEPIELSQGEGVHYTMYSPEADAFVDNFSSPSIPRKIVLRKADRKAKATLLLAAKDPTEGYAMPEITVGTLTANDQKTKLYYRLVKPLNFDPTKKYPTIVYVYGGPHAQLVTSNWLSGASGWDIYMAQQGYVIFTLDNRGSANRGKDFEQAIWKQVGTVEMQDQMTGVDFLKSMPWVDKDRIGVYGWSFGGFMTTNLMLTHSDTFKVGVAGGPVMDWSRYEIMYGERYNGSPQDNPEGYKANNLTLRAGDLKGRLLLIHGVVDNVVLWQHAIEFVQAAVKAGTYPDCMYYPRHQHNVIGPDRVHLHYTITRYFKDHL